MKIYKLIMSIIWLLLLVSIGVYYLTSAPRSSHYSENENRELAGLPELSCEAVFSGDYSTRIETYLLDNFPMRSHVIAFSNNIKDIAGFASYADYIAIKPVHADELDNPDISDDIDSLIADILTPKVTVAEVPATATPAPPTDGVQDTPTVTPTDGAQGTPAVTPTDVAQDMPTITPTIIPTAIPTTVPTNTPTITPTDIPGSASLEDFPEKLGVYMTVDNKTTTLLSYSRNNVAALTVVLNKYASLLNNDGKLVFTMVPQSQYANRYFNTSKNGRFYSDFEECISAFAASNVTAVSAADILGEAMNRGEYVYFRTDMHWTPYGTHLVYQEMAKAAGIEPTAYSDFDITVESPFLGTYYRDNPTSYMKENADILELLSPRFAFEWRRITGRDQYKLIDFLNFNAKSNDRYTVYLGGPAGPWTYTDSDNGADKNCLIITDSFGLAYVPMLASNYKQVHYYDPRYFDADVVGYSVAELIALYDITDCYVVIGDLHSFDSNFILNYANSQLGE